MKFNTVLEWAREGRRHDIPWCCGCRFGLDQVLAVPWYRLGRLGFHLMRVRDALKYSPRHAFAVMDAQGYIPCEYHLVRWVLTGNRPTIRQDEEQEER